MKVLNHAEFRAPSLVFIDEDTINAASIVLEKFIKEKCSIRPQDYFEMKIEDDIVTINKITGEYIYKFKRGNPGQSELELLTYKSYMLINS